MMSPWMSRAWTTFAGYVASDVVGYAAGFGVQFGAGLVPGFVELCGEVGVVRGEPV
jgi:hypothetical protein